MLTKTRLKKQIDKFPEEFQRFSVKKILLKTSVKLIMI